MNTYTPIKDSFFRILCLTCTTVMLSLSGCSPAISNPVRSVSSSPHHMQSTPPCPSVSASHLDLSSLDRSISPSFSTSDSAEESALSPAVSSFPAVFPEPADNDFVKITDYLPDCVVELRYATENNFTGQQIYDFSDAWLRYGTVKKLILVQEELQAAGLYLKIWDAFRPAAAQFKLWEVYPDPVYVANPNKGFSSHTRGNTVDITLVYADGSELVMPTAFDDFSKLADRDYSDCEKEAANNAQLLEQVMNKHGFRPYQGEWWHFSDTITYEVEKTFLSEQAQ